MATDKRNGATSDLEVLGYRPAATLDEQYRLAKGTAARWARRKRVRGMVVNAIAWASEEDVRREASAYPERARTIRERIGGAPGHDRECLDDLRARILRVEAKLDELIAMWRKS